MTVHQVVVERRGRDSFGSSVPIAYIHKFYVEVVSTVLPPVVNEHVLFIFKFWFNNNIQEGMYYKDELFYRLHTVELPCRARLYHYACVMGQQDTVVVSASEEKCSIWVGLRSPSVNPKTLRHQPLPQFVQSVPSEQM